MSYRSIRLALAVLFAAAFVVQPAAQERRPLTVDDIFALKNVGDPRVAPDGQWVAYTVSQMDAEKDASDTDIWMAPINGGEALRLTTSERSESRPRWSPDGRWLAFLSGRHGGSTQVWLLPRRGGEAQRLTDVEQGVSGMEWSPDSTRLALLVQDPEESEDETEEGEEAATTETAAGGDAGDSADERPKPIVVNRLQFKLDGVGYLDERRTHLYVFDVNLKCTYRGRFDAATPGNTQEITGSELRAAVEATLAGQPTADEQIPSIGCNIKWK